MIGRTLEEAYEFYRDKKIDVVYANSRKSEGKTCLVVRATEYGDSVELVVSDFKLDFDEVLRKG